jgi:hypothetical protein
MSSSRSIRAETGGVSELVVAYSLFPVESARIVSLARLDRIREAMGTLGGRGVPRGGGHHVRVGWPMPWIISLQKADKITHYILIIII